MTSRVPTATAVIGNLYFSEEGIYSRSKDLEFSSTMSLCLSPERAPPILCSLSIPVICPSPLIVFSGTQNIDGSSQKEFRTSSVVLGGQNTCFGVTKIVHSLETAGDILVLSYILFIRGTFLLKCYDLVALSLFMVSPSNQFSFPTSLFW